ncbi:hypothetical protein [Actinosynnema mirum]|uniref:hypothetical protein n=1 Tax=Actinosynnema mirum TaxID=40567 RepID=UPI0005A03180|nr:hypothetical protein [Actinosynnema mirum]
MPTEQPDHEAHGDTPFQQQRALADRCLTAARAVEPPFNPQSVLEDLAHDLVFGRATPVAVLEQAARRENTEAEDPERWLDTVIAVLNRIGLVIADRDGVNFPDQGMLAHFAGACLARQHPSPDTLAARALVRLPKFRDERRSPALIALVAHWQHLGCDVEKVIRRLARPWVRKPATGAFVEMRRYGVQLPKQLVDHVVNYLKRSARESAKPAERTERVLELHALRPEEALRFLAVEVRRQGAGPKRAAFALLLFELGREAAFPALSDFMVDPTLRGRRADFWGEACVHDRALALDLLDLALEGAYDGAVRNELTEFLALDDPERADRLYLTTMDDPHSGERARCQAAMKARPRHHAQVVEGLFEHLVSFQQRDVRRDVMRLLLEHAPKPRLAAELVRYHQNTARRPELRFDAACFHHSKLGGPPEPMIAIAHENRLDLDDALTAVKANPRDRRVAEVCDEQVRRHKPGGPTNVLDVIKKIERECGHLNAVNVVRYYAEVLGDSEWDYDIRKKALEIAESRFTTAEVVRFCQVLFDDPKSTPPDKLGHAETVQKRDRTMGVALFREFLRIDVDDRTRLTAAEKVDDRRVRLDLCELVAASAVKAGEAKLGRSALTLAWETDQDKALDLAVRVLRDLTVDHEPLLRDFRTKDRQEVLRRLAPPEKTNPA